MVIGIVIGKISRYEEVPLGKYNESQVYFHYNFAKKMWWDAEILIGGTKIAEQ